MSCYQLTAKVSIIIPKHVCKQYQGQQTKFLYLLHSQATKALGSLRIGSGESAHMPRLTNAFAAHIHVDESHDQHFDL